MHGSLSQARSDHVHGTLASQPDADTLYTMSPRLLLSVSFFGVGCGLIDRNEDDNAPSMTEGENVDGFSGGASTGGSEPDGDSSGGTNVGGSAGEGALQSGGTSTGGSGTGGEESPACSPGSFIDLVDGTPIEVELYSEETVWVGELPDEGVLWAGATLQFREAVGGATGCGAELVPMGESAEEFQGTTIVSLDSFDTAVQSASVSVSDITGVHKLVLFSGQIGCTFSEVAVQLFPKECVDSAEEEFLGNWD